ncbi:uncharacterized protein TNCV_3691991 [Trichonephila clavipes]|nr:uncharacterized protein TNCV_3691991 [Trichonephila clavipes]
MPIMMKAGKYLGKHLLSTGQNVLKICRKENPLKKLQNINCGKLVKRLKKDILRKLKGGGGVKRKKQSSRRQTKRKSLARKTCLLICEKMEKCYCTKSELDLFTSSPIQLAIDRSSFAEIHPVASISDNNTIEFLISGLGESYFDLSHLFLHVQARILKGNGEAFQNDDKCGPINYLLNTMFAECHISLNDRQISSENNYAYKAYIQTQHKTNVSYDDYKENICLYVFDLTQDKSASEPFGNVTRSGDISIHLKFDAELPETATLIAYMEMPSLIEIDKSRNVFIDY